MSVTAINSLLIRRAAHILHAGGVIAYPTEAVYGLGCDPASFSALERIIHLKGRSSSQGLILVSATVDLLEGWISSASTLADVHQQQAANDKPTTWIVPAGPLASALLTGNRDTLAVRITHHPIAAALSLAAGMPLVSTSANRHGRRPLRAALAVRRQLGPWLDLVVPGATGGATRPSEIRDARTGAILRRG